MDIVNPQPIRSPFTGNLVRPRLQTREYLGKVYTEAHWTCPDSGQYIRKGLVKVEDAPNSKSKNRT
jgi:hypothetical protein